MSRCNTSGCAFTFDVEEAARCATRTTILIVRTPQARTRAESIILGRMLVSTRDLFLVDDRSRASPEAISQRQRQLSSNWLP